ncbi:transglutaminase family protein [Megalodesulfovibrio paquesii]
MNYRIIHTTRFRHSEPVPLSHNEARLSPRDFSRQTCTRNRYHIVPKPRIFRKRFDYFGNQVCYFSIEEPHSELTVSVTSEVQVADAGYDTPGPGDDIPWEAARQLLRHSDHFDIAENRDFMLDSSLIAATGQLQAYAVPSFPMGRPLLLAARDLMERIHHDFAYVPGFTEISTPLEEVLAHRRGVCQDFAHLAIGCLRSMGLAARYVSGYIETLPPPGQEKLVGTDASHAWFSVYVPEHGWMDFDPTNNQIPMDRHITLAWGRDYADVPPLKGVIYTSGAQAMDVTVDVMRLEG